MTHPLLPNPSRIHPSFINLATSRLIELKKSVTWLPIITTIMIMIIIISFVTISAA